MVIPSLAPSSTNVPEPPEVVRRMRRSSNRSSRCCACDVESAQAAPGRWRGCEEFHARKANVADVLSMSGMSVAHTDLCESLCSQQKCPTVPRASGMKIWFSPLAVGYPGRASGLDGERAKPPASRRPVPIYVEICCGIERYTVRAQRASQLTERAATAGASSTAPPTHE